MADADVHCATCYCSLLSNNPSEPETFRLDQRIQALRKELHVLSSYRNALSRINQLPHEVLLKIFHSVLESDSETPTFRELTSIASVCAHWRTIAIKDPTLWVQIEYAENSNVIECIVERTRSLPLTVQVDFRSGGSFAWEFSKVAGRLRKLEVATDNYIDMENAMERLECAGELSILENVSLRCPYDISQRALVINAPNLSALDVCNVAIQVPPNKYSATIRHFTAHYELYGPWPVIISLTQWVDFFLAIPNLESLDLRYPIFLNDATLESENRVVSLPPSLRKFVFRESVYDGTGFLRRFSIPTEATVDITIDTSPDGDFEAQIGLIFSAIKPIIRSHDAKAHLHTLALVSPTYLLKEPNLNFSFPFPRCPLWLSKTPISFTIIHSENDEDYPAKLEQMVTGMKLATSDISHLSKLASDGSSESLFYALQQFEWVETLILFGALWPRCLEDLLIQDREDRINALSRVHTLVLRGVPFHWAERSYVLDFLEGTAIRTIQIETSTGVCQEDIDTLRKNVDVVMWDEDGSDVVNRFSPEVL